MPNNQQSVNLILAGVRVGQNTPDPIRKYIDQKCFVTDDGRFATIMGGLTGSARLSVAYPMDTPALTGRVTEIADAISAMEQDIATPHLALLINAMYSDEHKDEPYKRLQYLQMWQSLTEAGKKPLNYQGDIRYDSVVLAGKHTLEELTSHRGQHRTLVDGLNRRELLGGPSANDQRTDSAKVFLIDDKQISATLGRVNGEIDRKTHYWTVGSAPAPFQLGD